MRWLVRSVLCVLVLITTSAPAQAWFEWLDYLSGPGPFYGVKVDLRVWCSGPPTPWKEVRASVDKAVLASLTMPRRTDLSIQWNPVFDGLARSNEVLPLFSQKWFQDMLEAGKKMVRALESAEPVAVDPLVVVRTGEFFHALVDRFERASVSIASTGIFISLCKSDRIRSLAVEIGFTALQANSNPDYALDHTIRLYTFTGGLSYRLPLPPDRDFIDIGFNAGMYRFNSRGFDGFSGFTLEPYVDLHGPTRLIDAGGLKQLGGLLSVRVGLVFFPGGFDGAQFASAPSKPERISGREGSLSATVFFNLTPLLWRRPPSTVWNSGLR
jgi:hypothetical protein